MTYFHTATITERHPGREETKLADGARLRPPMTPTQPSKEA